MSLTASQRALLEKRRPRDTPAIFRSSRNKQVAMLSHPSRIGGLIIIAPSGGGKSILLGKHVVLPDAQQGMPQVVIDVSGQTVNNFLHGLLLSPRMLQQTLLKRIVYCEMAGAYGFVPSWPMLAPQIAGESLTKIASRVSQLLGQLDENFANATIQGLTRTIPIANVVGKLLTALNLPISHVHELLLYPERYADRITDAVKLHPEAHLAAVDFLDFLALDAREREFRSEPFRNRLQLIRHNDSSRAMFASTRKPSVDWESVSVSGKTVLISLGGETDPDARQWALYWVFNSLLDYLGTRGRGKPFGVVIDELAFFVRGAALNTQAITEKFRELIELRSRNNAVFLTLATQDIKQLPKDLASAVLNIKSHLYGAVTDYDTAISLARRFYPMDPWEVKHWKPIYGSNHFYGKSTYYAIDWEPIYLSLSEQEYRNSRHFVALKKGQWLYAESSGEGQPATRVRSIATPQLFQPPFFEEHKAELTKLSAALSRRDGVSIAEVLAEIEEQRRTLLPPPAVPVVRRHRKEPVRSKKRTAPVPALEPNGKAETLASEPPLPNGALRISRKKSLRDDDE